jgi:hypothetical protein
MTQWHEDIEAAIEDAVGAEVAGSVRTRWREHAARDKVEVTLFGPYDSGKSSLLKRLLHEDGQPTPGWLTISARRETWETNEVHAHGLTFTDTPGVAAGNQDHERTATETITLTDAMLVVVPPQLLTGERDLVLPVVNGRLFAPGSGWRFPHGAMAFAITRLDEGGIDPGESGDAFRTFAAGKSEELRALLAQVGAEDVPVHRVVADPYGLVGNDDGDYQRLGDVDGIAELIHHLRALAGRKDELRSAARVRYLLHAGYHVAETVGQHLGRTELRAAELGRRIQDQEAVRGELNDLMNAASASLRNAINDEAQAVAEQTSSAESDLNGALASRVEVRVAAWRAEWDAQLADLAERLAERYEAAEQRPMTALIDDLLTSTPNPVDRSVETATRAWDLIEESAKVLNAGVRKAVKVSLGMDLAEAQQELKRLEGLSADDLAKELSSNPALKNLDRFRDVIGKATVAAELAPVVSEVVRGLIALWREEATSTAKLDDLEQRRARLRDVSSAMADEIMGSWREGIDQLLTSAERAVELLIDTKRGVDDDISRLREAKARLDMLLAQAPPP